MAGCVSPQADSGPVSWQGRLSHSWPGISWQTAQVFTFINTYKYPFWNCKMSAQEFPSNFTQSHWKHLDKHHYQKHPITSLRKTMEDSRLDRRLDVNCRILDNCWTEDNRIASCCVYPPCAVPPSMNRPITDREKKRTNQSARFFNSPQTKHSLLLFRERPFIQPSSNICSFLYPFRDCWGQRTQTGRQKMPGSLSCNQPLQDCQDALFDPFVLKTLPFASRPELKQP